MTTARTLGAAIAALTLVHTALAEPGTDPSSTRFASVDFSDQYNIRADRDNIDRTGFYNADTMPNDAQETREGVPFEFGPDHGRYAWNALFAEGESLRVLDIDTDLPSAVRVYTMINTFWGTADPGQLAIEFLGSDGAFHREELRGNLNVRDYSQNGSTTNDLRADNVRNVYDNHEGQRVDMQTWTLPDDFADETLAKIRVVDTGADERSRAMVWAITVEVLENTAARDEALALLAQARAERDEQQPRDARDLIESIREQRAADAEASTHADRH